MPAPATSFVWSLLNIIIYRFESLHPVYWLVTSVILGIGNTIAGGFEIVMYL